MDDQRERNRVLSASAFELVRNDIPRKDAEFIADLIFDSNEWGLGIETLIDVLLEQQIAISDVQKSAILSAAESMKIVRGQTELQERSK